MKVNPPPWSDEEKQYMRERYPFDTVAALALALKRPMNGVRKMAVTLGLRKDAVTLGAIRRAGAKRAWAVKGDGRPEPVRRAAQAGSRAWPAATPDTGPDALAHRKRLRREAAAALVAHGVDEIAAELATDLIVRGLVPHVSVEW